MSGPPPKRSDERRRRNKDAVATQKVDVAELSSHEVEIPVASEDWDPVTVMIWESLPRSGQAIFYEPADWAAAYLMCESIDRDLKPQVVGITETGEVIRDVIPLKGASLSAYIKMMTSLLMTEGDRRRARIELERQKAKDAAAGGEGKVVSISKTRQARFQRNQQEAQ